MLEGNSCKHSIRFTILLILCLCKHSFPATVNQYLESPCPNIFQYSSDERGELYGTVQISPPDNNKVQLNLELSVGNNVEGYNGNIELVHSKEKVVDDIMQRRSILYKVYFPVWNSIPPKITKILVNGDLICSGPKIAISLVPVLTTINLQHTLRIDVQPLVSSSESFVPPRQSPSDINFIPPEDISNGDSQLFDSIKTTTQKSVIARRTNNPSSIESITPFSIESDFSLIPKDKVATGRPYDNICGRSVTTNSLVINGNTVPRGAYPWLVAMFGVKPTGLTYMCSGSLISDRHIVTAAHCVRTESKKFRPQELLIILGKLNIQKWVPANGEKMIEPESIHVHPDYDSMSSDADIAVLILSENVEFTKYIRPLCLWDGSMDLNLVVEQQGTVVGWGKDENGDIMTAEPKQTKLPIVSQETCLRSSYQFQYITSNRTFCAGFRNGSGPCNGDSGSGFLLKKDGRWVLRGIVSMSISESHSRTCDLSNYVVFTDASKFLDWLLSFIK